jgi:hypothetical protein
MIIFQLISSLFCEAKRGFVCRPLKNSPFEVNYLVWGGDQPIYYKVFFPQKYLQGLCQHTCSSSKISMRSSTSVDFLLSRKSRNKHELSSSQVELHNFVRFQFSAVKISMIAFGRQGCRIFSWCTIPKPEKCTKGTQNVPNGHRISHMSITYSK